MCIKKIKIMLILIIFLLLSACNSDNERSTRPAGQTVDSGSEPSVPVPPGTTEDEDEAKPEVTYIINPVDKTLDDKVTIPKNFGGVLYIDGINIGSLSNKHVSVRFKFGTYLDSITIPATVGLATGVLSQTHGSVLILQMNSRPFKNVRLLYDLFDYNSYKASEAPTLDPLNEKLYCRGLTLDYDSTFRASKRNDECDEEGERCLYAYAKVFDSGLYPTTGTIAALVPSSPQINEDGTSYSPSSTRALQKCLPDNNDSTNFYSVLGLSNASLGIGTTVTLGSALYSYNGPFRTSAESVWAIKPDSAALFSDTSATPAISPTGLFEKSWSGLSASNGYRSFLFPRAGKMVLRSSVQYFGSSDVFGARTLRTNVSNGETSYYMDGCNFRVTNFDASTSEGISSCNVTAIIEVITKDPETSTESVVTSSTNLKLQLVRGSFKNSEEEEVKISSFKSCNTSNSCASDECCFNNQCWNDSFISHCPGEVDSNGNLGIGLPCQTDFDCASLCCKTGVCADHHPTGVSPAFCSKPLGERCIASEWCAKVDVYQCDIVLTPNGTHACAIRCKKVPTHGLCKNEYCTSPPQPIEPEFDPNNPICDDAIDPSDWTD